MTPRSVPAVQEEKAPSLSGRFDDVPLNASDAAPPTPASADAAQAPPTARPSGDGLDLARLAGALAVVLGVIWVVKLVAARFLPQPDGGGAGKAVRVVSRTAIGARQQVVVLQVGRRVVVACDSAGRVTTLSEITDPDEVAALLGRSAAARTADDADLADAGESDEAAKSAPFGALFARQRDRFDDESDGPDGPRPDGDSGGDSELGGLADRVRLLTAQFRRG